MNRFLRCLFGHKHEENEPLRVPSYAVIDGSAELKERQKQARAKLVASGHHIDNPKTVRE